MNSNKNKVYKLLFDNSIKLLIKILKDGQTDIIKLLSICAHERYKIEYILSKVFPKLDLEINLEKFGRCRSKNDSHGRPFIERKINYKPFNFLLEKDHIECLITPIYKKYGHYDNFIKTKCIYLNSYITNEPVLHLLYKFDPRGYTTLYNSLELTTFYYELNGLLYKELTEIPIQDRQLSKDINLYRAIYHTNPKFHLLILNEIQIELNIILNSNITYLEKLNSIIKIFWWLSQATLYDRGSCAITELLCNSLFLYINSSNKIFISRDNVNLDIEAMLCLDPFTFIDIFNQKIKYRPLSELKYELININKNIIFNTSKNINSIHDLFLKKETTQFKSLMEEFDN